jgi:hypothetical protein
MNTPSGNANFYLIFPQPSQDVDSVCCRLGEPSPGHRHCSVLTPPLAASPSPPQAQHLNAFHDDTQGLRCPLPPLGQVVVTAFPPSPMASRLRPPVHTSPRDDPGFAAMDGGFGALAQGQHLHMQHNPQQGEVWWTERVRVGAEWGWGLGVCLAPCSVHAACLHTHVPLPTVTRATPYPTPSFPTTPVPLFTPSAPMQRVVAHSRPFSARARTTQKLGMGGAGW